MKPFAASPFGEGMVLQRNHSLSIWGQADPDAEITVSIQDACVRTTASTDGSWSCTLPPLHTSVSETLTISSEEGSTIYSDVMVGEVWLAGGQSNMEFFMRYDADFDAVVRLCNDPLFRYYDVPKASAPEQLEMRDYSLFGFWRKADPEDLQYFSAAAYYFGSSLREALQVPVGIIGCNWGGTKAACWMSREAVEKCGPEWIADYEEGLKNIDDLDKARRDYYANINNDNSHPFDRPFPDKLLYGVSTMDEMMECFSKMEGGPGYPIGPWHEFRPCGMYEEMLSKVIPYRIAGVIWYQGESDVDHAEIYADMMCGLINEWRREWGQDFPFLMTQLAPLGNTDNELVLSSCLGFPEIRKQQVEITKRMRDVYLASSSDAGHDFDIHPKNKRPIGKRLALLALANVYGFSVKADAPEPTGIVKDGNEISIRFKNAEGGLILAGDTVNALCISDKEGKVLPSETMTASIKNDTLFICLDDTAGEAAKVEFASTPYYQVNLYNMAGIPAMPFTLGIPVQR